MQEMDSNPAKAAVAEFYQVYEIHGKEAAFRVFNALEREFDALAREQRDIRPTLTEVLYATGRFFDKYYLATYSRAGDLIRFSNRPELSEYTSYSRFEAPRRQLGHEEVEARQVRHIFMRGTHVDTLFCSAAPFPLEIKKDLED